MTDENLWIDLMRTGRLSKGRAVDELRVNLPRWADSLKAEGISRRTIELYTRGIKAIYRWFESPVTEWTPEKVQAWRLERASKVKGSTLNLDIATIHRYLRWVGRDDLCESVGKMVKVPRRPAVNVPSREEVEKMLAAARRMGLGEYAFVLTLAHTGLRRMEALMMRPEDVDLAAKRVVVKYGKGNKERAVPMSHRLETALTEWLDLRLKKIEQGNWPEQLIRGKISVLGINSLWPWNDFDIWASRGWYYEMGEIAGVIYSPHKLRNFFATTCWNVLQDIVLLQQWLGHATVEQTRRYIQSLPDTKQLVKIRQVFTDE